MKKSKVNVEIALAQNYDKVTVSIVDEPIEYDSEADLKTKISKIRDVIRGEVNDEFKKIAEARK
jgi:hypothetical protein